jgi:hypothetical protein
MIWGFILASLIGQTPDRTGPPYSHAQQAWHDAVKALRSPNSSYGFIGNQPLDAAFYFREAADCYEAHIRDEGADQDILRWLGYSYHAAGDLPHAIAAYRRGLALDPADTKLRTALEYARDQVAYPPVSGLRPAWELWPPWLSLRYVGLYAFGLYFAGCLAATRWRMTRRRRWLVIAGLLFAVTAVPVIGTAIEWQRERRDAAEPVVVISRDVPLRAGNGSDYPAKLELPRGCEVRRLFERGAWLQVETANGAAGWVPRDAVVNGRET